MDRNEREELRALLAVASLLQAGGPGVETVTRVLDALDAETARADALERRVADVEEDALIARSRLETRIAELEQQRKMEDAPRDGTWILVFNDATDATDANSAELMQYSGDGLWTAGWGAWPAEDFWRWMSIPTRERSR
jgi:hypothetical protein